MLTADATAIKAMREANDPHRLIPTYFRSKRFLVYCNVSQRTEGTVRMEGHTCSYCGKEL